MDTKKLRQKILDLAIHGKLVPQDPNDEPASVLLERIRAEKERLIAEGKIKRSKKSATSDTSHYENVAEGWVLTDIGELLINRDSERVPLSLGVRSKQENKIYDYYGATGVVDKVDGYLFDERLLLIGEDGANLLSRSKDNAFFAEGKYWVNNHAHILDCPEKEVLDYVAFLINSMSLEDYITGSAQPKLNQDNLNKIEIPLPPLEEQRRIIAQVNLWQNYIQDLEASEIELKESVESAKSKILDLAIHGKLVPQDANDEPASELLKRINPKAVASCDNPHYEQVPFEIPSNWLWVKLGDITNYGKCSTCSVDDINNESWILELEDIEKDTGRVLVRHSKAEREIKGVRHSFYAGNILYSKLRTYLNKVLVAKEDGFCTTEIIPIECCDSVHPDYICNILRSKYFLDYTAQCGYGVKMPRLSTTDARKALIPLPPYKEQIRISEKIDVLMGALNAIVETLV